MYPFLPAHELIKQLNDFNRTLNPGDENKYAIEPQTTRSDFFTYATKDVVEAEEEDEEEEGSIPSPPKSADEFVNQRIQKLFKKEKYYGTVVGFDGTYYQINYDDGDSEEMTKNEVFSHLVKRKSTPSPFDKSYSQKRQRTSGGSGGTKKKRSSYTSIFLR